MSDGNSKKVLLTVPSGNIGGRVAHSLVHAGVPLAVLGREGHLDDIGVDVRNHADVHLGNLVDAAAMTTAAAGASAMFVIYPVDPVSPDISAMWRELTAAAVHAVEANGITHVVLLSSQGADTGGSSMLDALFEAEKDFAAVTPNLRVLRPGFFMENLLPDLEMIAEGRLPVCALPTTLLRMVATVDVSVLSAELLTDLSWSGHELLAVYGPDELTAEQVASTISSAVERPVAYEYADPQEFLGALLEYGFSRGTAEPMVDLFASFGALEEGPDTRKHDHITVTTLDAFTKSAILPSLQAMENV